MGLGLNVRPRLADLSLRLSSELEEHRVPMQVVTISWCKPITCGSLDPSLIPARAGIYEILWDTAGGRDRIFMGESEDIRRSLIEHLSGRTEFAALADRVLDPHTSFRYWLCDSRVRRSQVAAALWDTQPYECGADWSDLGGSCVQLHEDE